MKKGAPMNAVTTPIGVSAGSSISRPGTSARIRNPAPPSSDSGNNRRWLAPAINLMTCGTTRPTKPMSPLTDTTAAVPSVAATTITKRVRATDTPSVAASSSPTRNTSRWRRWNISTTQLIVTYGVTSRTSSQVDNANVPVIQRNTSRITSEFRSRIHVCVAEVKDTTATPASTSVTPLRDPPKAAPTVYVTRTVATANTNAVAGTGSTGQVAVVVRAMVSAIVAPSPAPAAAPSRYGSTSGLRKTPWYVAPAIESIPPTSAPSTTRGMRIFQTIAHSRSVTPESIESTGNRSSNSSGTRHQSGPAGPKEAPATTANARNTPAPTNQRKSLPAPRSGSATTRCVATDPVEFAIRRELAPSPAHPIPQRRSRRCAVPNAKRRPRRLR